MSVVEVSNLTVRFGSTTAVNGASFEANAGEITVLLGPNGAGKTTTLECLEGYQTPTAGSVRVCGLDPCRDRSALNERVGIMLQAGGVYTTIRPLEALELFAAYYRHPRPPEELLSFVGLAHRASVPWRNLSGGEQQRLSLALSLVGRPDVVFLDEPSAGVDLTGKELIRGLIGRLRAEGVTVLFTTHDLADLDQLADRIIILDEGIIVADGSPDELLSSASSDSFRFRAQEGLPLAALSEALGVEVVEASPGHYLVGSPPSPGLVARLTSWLAQHEILVGEIQAGRQRLESVFALLTSHAESPEESTASHSSRGTATRGASERANKRAAGRRSQGRGRG